VVAGEVLGKIESENLSVHVVWTPVLGPDNRHEATGARALLGDPRVKHYWDGERSLGMSYGRLVKLPGNRELAWDIYFAFSREKEWTDRLPEPDAWAHQLGRDGRHLGDGAGLRAAVLELLVTAPKGAEAGAAVP